MEKNSVDVLIISERREFWEPRFHVFSENNLSTSLLNTLEAGLWSQRERVAKKMRTA